MRFFTFGFISAAVLFLTLVARADAGPALPFPENIDPRAAAVDGESATSFYRCLSGRSDLVFESGLTGGRTLKGHLTLGRDGIFELRYDIVEDAVAGSPPDEEEVRPVYGQRVTGPWSVEGTRVFLSGVAMGAPTRGPLTRKLTFELISEKEDAAALGSGSFEVQYVKHAFGPDVCH